MKKPNKQKQTVDKLIPALVSACQAIARKRDLDIYVDDRGTDSPLSTRKRIIVSRPDHEQDSDIIRRMRGQADLASLSLRHHDDKQHSSKRPKDEKSASVYDALEQMRLECLGATRMPGMKRNLEHRMEMHCEIQGYSRLSERADPPLGDVLSLLLREKITGAKPPESIRRICQLWKPAVDKHFKKHFSRLSDNLEDQAAFRHYLTRLLKDLSLLDNQLEKPEGEQEEEDADSEEELEENNDAQDESDAPESGPSGGPEQPNGAEQEQIMPAMGDDDGAQNEETDEQEAQYTPRPPQFESMPEAPTYKAYTKAYDEVVVASQLADEEELTRLRAQLDMKLKDMAQVTGRLAAQLQRLLLARQSREWIYDLDDGLIDSARLARLVTRPDITSIYKQEHDTPYRDTVISLLIDNSGSMRGRPITIAALSTDILARTLERCGVKVEILGFTTRDWKGGNSRKQWMNDGRPEKPGRLNDLRHIIYKSADMRLGRARKNLALMLKDGVLKENIDGEALLWAHGRLLQRPEQRRILLVISDGAPVDDATLSQNSGGYLDQHLRNVITSIEQYSDVELLAIGIGHDVSRYYQKAVTLHNADKLADTLLEQMRELFTEKR